MTGRKVYLVGAGPGDAGLITLKGYHLIRCADVILYDHLIPDELLKLARADAEVTFVGKSAGHHTLVQDEINRLLVEKAQNGKIVVRLKGGDPFLFGRGGEEAEALAEAGVDFEIVPGVTSALSAPAYAGIPPTHRDYTSSVAIVTGHRRDEGQIEIPKAGTIIFLMGVANLPRIITSLLDGGWPARTKIAAIENGTRYNQKVVTGTLEDFPEKVEAADIRPPCVFVVGKVVELHQRLDWFSRKPRILLLGTHPEKYHHLGTIVHRPMIDCVALEDYSKADAVLKALAAFQWIVFTSANGIRFFFERLVAIGLDSRALASSRVAVIGKTSAQYLARFGIKADMCPDTESSKGLIEKFETLDIAGSKILLPQAEAASTELAQGLSAMGAEVEALALYRTVELEPDPIDFENIDWIIFTSGSTIRSFVKRFGSVPAHIKAYCLGPPSLAEAKKHNINAELLKQTGDCKQGKTYG